MKKIIAAVINKKTLTDNIQVMQLALIESLPIQWLDNLEMKFISGIKLSVLAGYPVLFIINEDVKLNDEDIYSELNNLN